MEPVRFGVIGCGMFSRQVHLPNLLCCPDAALQTCCDINPSNLDACRDFFPRRLTRDFQQVVKDPEIDALVIATTESLRLPVIEAAASAEKPVYCEKPLADSLEAALAIKTIVEQSGIPFCVGHNRRCAPAMAEAQRIFVNHMRQPQACGWRFEREGWQNIPVGSADGSPVMQIRINDDWRSWKSVHTSSPLNREIGLLLSEATHFVDLACWFLQSEPVRVSCMGRGILNHLISISFANGGLASITMAATGSFAYPKELVEAIGNAGVVAVDHMLELRTSGIKGAPAVKRYAMLHDRHSHLGKEDGLHGWLAKKQAACREAEEAGDPMLQFTAEPDRGHLPMLEEFIREIRGERGPVSPVAPAVTVTRACLAIAKAFREKRTVDVCEIS